MTVANNSLHPTPSPAIQLLRFVDSAVRRILKFIARWRPQFESDVLNLGSASHSRVVISILIIVGVVCVSLCLLVTGLPLPLPLLRSLSSVLDETFIISQLVRP